MPNSKVPVSSPTTGSAKLDRKLRLSLPEKEKSHAGPSGTQPRRNTISEDSSLPRTRKKSKHLTPTIPEDENESSEKEPDFVIENETKKISELVRTSSGLSKASAISSKSTKSTKTAYTYENGAFEGNIRASNEVRPTSRTPSVRSLEVYREQYCCCAKRTKCERYLLVAVTILSIIVIVLVIVIAVLAKNGDLDTYKMFKVKL